MVAGNDVIIPTQRSVASRAALVAGNTQGSTPFIDTDYEVTGALAPAVRVMLRCRGGEGQGALSVRQRNGAELERAARPAIRTSGSADLCVAEKTLNKQILTRTG